MNYEHPWVALELFFLLLHIIEPELVKETKINSILSGNVLNPVVNIVLILNKIFLYHHLCDIYN